ncbi:hypothetical protein Hanom_Chr16g01501661 [Helianthus anomalus]
MIIVFLPYKLRKLEELAPFMVFLYTHWRNLNFLRAGAERRNTCKNTIIFGLNLLQIH